MERDVGHGRKGGKCFKASFIEIWVNTRLPPVGRTVSKHSVVAIIGPRRRCRPSPEGIKAGGKRGTKEGLANAHDPLAHARESDVITDVGN